MNFWDWFWNNFFYKVLGTILPGIAALAAIFFRTKKDEPKKLSNRLTFFGISMIIITIAGVCVGVSSQYQDDETNSEKVNQDTLRRNFQHEELIAKFQAQRTIDSTQISLDDKRYKKTISKIDTELSKQNVALLNINEVLHPLFPLTIAYTLEYNLNEFKTDPTIYNVLHNFSYNKISRLDGTNGFENKPMHENPILYERKHSYNPAYTDTNDLETLLNHLIPFNLHVSISSNGSNYDEDRSIFLFQLRDVNSEFNYTYDIKTEVLNIQITAEIKPSDLIKNSVLSLEDTKLYFLGLDIYQNKIESPFELTNFTFYCGNSFFNSYSVTFSPENFKNVYRHNFYFLKKIE